MKFIKTTVRNVQTAGELFGFFGRQKRWWLLPIIVTLFLLGALIGTLLGLFLPRLVHHWNLDPKIASGPAVLAITDILTLTAYLGLAAWVLL